MLQEIYPEVIALLLQDFPESLVMTLFIFSMVKITYETKPILWITTLMAVTNLLVRQLPIAFGVHTVIIILAFALFTRLFTRAQLSKIFLSLLLVMAIIVAAEMIYSQPLLKLTGLTYEECFGSPILRAAFALPGELTVLLVALVINHYNAKKRGYENAKPDQSS
jgi:phosphoglycerol transferase MdoB-like AlkP superfamily enzyme